MSRLRSERYSRGSHGYHFGSEERSDTDWSIWWDTRLQSPLHSYRRTSASWMQDLSCWPYDKHRNASGAIVAALQWSQIRLLLCIILRPTREYPCLECMQQVFVSETQRTHKVTDTSFLLHILRLEIRESRDVTARSIQMSQLEIVHQDSNGPSKFLFLSPRRYYDGSNAIERANDEQQIFWK